MKMRLLLGMLMFCTLGFLASCGGGDTGGGTNESGPEYTSAYICPMHCKGSGAAEMGKCPVCGMDYVANEKNGGGDGHDHSHDHDGHDHGHDHDGHDHNH